MKYRETTYFGTSNLNCNTQKLDKFGSEKKIVLNFPVKKKIFLQAKIINTHNHLLYEGFTGCSNLGCVFQVM